MIRLARLAPVLALLLAACTQGAGPAPDARPDDPEVAARARLLVAGLLPEDAARGVAGPAIASRRDSVRTDLLAHGFTPDQSRAMLDLFEELVIQRLSEAVVDIYAQEVARFCSPLELELAVPGEGLGPCGTLRGKAIRRAADAQYEVSRDRAVDEAMLAYVDAVERRAPEMGLTTAQVAFIRNEVLKTLSQRRTGG